MSDLRQPSGFPSDRDREYFMRYHTLHAAKHCFDTSEAPPAGLSDSQRADWIMQALFELYQQDLMADKVYLWSEMKRWEIAARHVGRISDARVWQNVADFVTTVFCGYASTPMIIAAAKNALVRMSMEKRLCNISAIGNIARIACRLHELRQEPQDAGVDPTEMENLEQELLASVRLNQV